MAYVLTFIAADERSSPLTPSHLIETVDILSRYISLDGDLDYDLLSWGHTENDDQGHAADLFIPSIPDGIEALKQMMTDLRAMLRADRIDVLISRTENRKAAVMNFDMDTTSTRDETLEAMARFAEDFACAHPGYARRFEGLTHALEGTLFDEIKRITDLAMDGEINLEDSLRLRVGLFKGTPVSVLEAALDDMKEKIDTGLTALIAQSRRLGETRSNLISSGYTYFTEPFGAFAGFDDHCGNVLEFEEHADFGRVLTGKLLNSPMAHAGYALINKPAKAEYFRQRRAQSRTEGKEGRHMMFGDGDNDRDAFHEAGPFDSVAIRARSAVLEDPLVVNVIEHGDWICMLYVQGYTDRDLYPRTDLKKKGEWRVARPQTLEYAPTLD